jgi:hypothetical protein
VKYFAVRLPGMPSVVSSRALLGHQPCQSCTVCLVFLIELLPPFPRAFYELFFLYLTFLASRHSFSFFIFFIFVLYPGSSRFTLYSPLFLKHSFCLKQLGLNNNQVAFKTHYEQLCKTQ